MSDERVLIVGASGYMGSAIAAGLRDEFEVFGTYFRHQSRVDGCAGIKMNCLDGNEIFDWLKRISPDTVIFAPQISNMDYCQDNHQAAENLHFQSATFFFK